MTYDSKDFSTLGVPGDGEAPAPSPGEGGGVALPLSKDNAKFTVLGGMIVTIIMVTLVCEVFIAIFVTSNVATIMSTVGGFAGLGLGQLFMMFRQEQSRAVSAAERRIISEKLDMAADHAEKAKTQVEELKNKVDGNLEKVIETTAHVVEHATAQQVLDSLPLPKTREELEALIKGIVEQSCGEIRKALEEAHAAAMRAEAANKEK